MKVDCLWEIRDFTEAMLNGARAYLSCERCKRPAIWFTRKMIDGEIISADKCYSSIGELRDYTRVYCQYCRLGISTELKYYQEL